VSNLTPIEEGNHDAFWPTVIRSHTEVPALLSQPDDLATLLFTCVGVPEYASRAGGGPGAPVEIRPVAERFKDE
jgi:hypothetical protein